MQLGLNGEKWSLAGDYPLEEVLPVLSVSENSTGVIVAQVN